MARFPQTEPEIAALALLVVQGLSEAAADFPAPPVSPDELQGKLDAYNAAAAAAVAAETVARQHHATKDDALEDLVDSNPGPRPPGTSHAPPVLLLLSSDAHPPPSAGRTHRVHQTHQAHCRGQANH